MWLNSLPSISLRYNLLSSIDNPSKRLWLNISTSPNGELFWWELLPEILMWSFKYSVDLQESLLKIKLWLPWKLELAVETFLAPPDTMQPLLRLKIIPS